MGIAEWEMQNTLQNLGNKLFCKLNQKSVLVTSLLK